MTFTLSDLGWSAHFMMQLEADDLEHFTLARVTQVHRSQINAITEAGEVTLTTKGGETTGDFAVGDWVLVDDDARIERGLERLTELKRKAAGPESKPQLIGANIDVLFITTSCNDDFNIARLERYLVLARAAGIQPVVILTKADLSDDPVHFEREVQTLDPALPVLAFDARDEEQVKALFDWWRPGQTASVVGSSGVGKTTLLNSLTHADLATQGIREDDAKGRHTTTARGLYPVGENRWLIDTPGMRELGLTDAGSGVEAVFADLVALAGACKFSDCGHEDEPGCAVQGAIASGDLDPDRLKRWQKLEREERWNNETIAEQRKRNKERGRYIKRVSSERMAMKGRPPK